jgi:hypothetical protein
LVVEFASWRIGLALCGWFGLLIFFMILAFIKNAHGEQVNYETAAPQPSMCRLAKMMLSSRLILIGLVGGTIYSAGLAFAMLWGVPFFQEHLNLNLAKASLFCLVLLLGNYPRSSGFWMGVWPEWLDHFSC